MPDDLYDRDILDWATREADLPRRLSRGEIDLDDVWRRATRRIAAAYQAPARPGATCPFTLDDLLATDVNVTDLARRLGEAAH